MFCTGVGRPPTPCSCVLGSLRPAGSGSRARWSIPRSAPRRHRRAAPFRRRVAARMALLIKQLCSIDPISQQLGCPQLVRHRRRFLGARIPTPAETRPRIKPQSVCHAVRHIPLAIPGPTAVPIASPTTPQIQRAAMNARGGRDEDSLTHRVGGDSCCTYQARTTLDSPFAPLARLFSESSSTAGRVLTRRAYTESVDEHAATPPAQRRDGQRRRGGKQIMREGDPT